VLPERCARDDSDSPFCIKTSRFPRSFAVLDKSFLDAIASPQLQLHAQNGWTFGIPEALMYELMRKRDEWRTKNLLKLCRIQESLVRLPGIGEMFRAEARLFVAATLVKRDDDRGAFPQLSIVFHGVNDLVDEAFKQNQR
jgi:hypothetical protein